jgi:pimeloyl-ACP methyl ester carboxylesterase
LGNGQVGRVKEVLDLIKSVIQLDPFLFYPDSGPPIPAERGQLFVPENRKKGGQHIMIPFVRFCSSSKKPGTPIIFLQGGPGEEVLEDLQKIWARPMWRPLLKVADFIFIEQRGSGLSRPNLDCSGLIHVPLGEPGSAGLYRDAHRTYFSRAVDYWQERGVDLGGYNVCEMAADIDDLRRALGYKKISLFGGSFGSHHGFALLRYYGPTIERAFLFGIEGPNHTLKLPGTIQKHLVKLDAMLKNDPAFNKHIPNLLELIADVLNRLEKKPETIETQHPQTKERVSVTLGKYDLQLVTAKRMGSTRFLQMLPALYLAMAKGDFSWLAEKVVKERVGQKGNLMAAITDCASGATATRREQISREAPAILFGNAINEPFHDFCDLFGNNDLGDEYRGKLVSNVPIALVCGSLDARTPVSNARELIPDLANSQLITIEGASHDLSIQGDHIEALTRCRDRFFLGERMKENKIISSFDFKKIGIF